MQSTFPILPAAIAVSLLAAAPCHSRTPPPDLTKGEPIPEGVTHFHIKP